MSRELWALAKELGLEKQNLLLIHQAPYRWDEILDLRLPTLISHEVGSWPEVLAGLKEAGFSPSQYRLQLHQEDSSLELNQELDSVRPEKPWNLLLSRAKQ